MSRKKLVFILFSMGWNLGVTIILAYACIVAMLGNGTVLFDFNHYNEGWFEFFMIPLIAITGIVSFVYLSKEYGRK